MSYTEAEHEARRERAEDAHPGVACCGCRLCDPVDGWSDPEPVGDTGWQRIRWIGRA